MRCRETTNKRRISTAYMIALNDYYRDDKDVKICRDHMYEEMFGHEWRIGWFREQEAIWELPMFNQPFFKEALRKFYAEAHDLIKQFNFFGYYYVKDIEAWLLEVGRTKPVTIKACVYQDELLAETNGHVKVELERSDYDDESPAPPLGYYEAKEERILTTEEQERYEALMIENEMAQLRENVLNNPPFGVITLELTEEEMYGQFVLVESPTRMKKSLVFECHDEVRASLYHFRVKDFDAQFKFPNPQEDEEAGIDVFYNYQELVPCTAFHDLKKQKQRIKEAELSLFDANSMRTYRDGYMIAKSLPLAQVDAISEANLYAFDDLLAARQADGLRQQNLAMNNADVQLQKLNMRRSIQASSTTNTTCNTRCTPFAKGQASIGWSRRLEFNRPAANELLEYVPQSVDIPNMPDPSPIVNVDARIRKYEGDVCTIMKLPYAFFKPHAHGVFDSGAGGSGGGSTRSNRGVGTISENDRYQQMLENEVRKQQALFESIFKEIYTHTFLPLDYQVNPSLRQIGGGELGILFNNTIVKSDEAIRYLLGFYDKGLIPGSEIRRFLYKNYDIKLSPEIEPSDFAERKILKAKRQVVLTKKEEDEESEPDMVIDEPK